MKQIVEHKKLGVLHGLLLVAFLLVILVLMNYLVLGLLATYIGNGASSIAFWVLGGLIAWAVLRIYVVKYFYLMNDDVLQLNRAYGKRERHIDNIYLSSLAFVGAPEEAKKRYPNAARINATHIKGEYPTVAVAYKTSGGHRIALIQPNDEIKSALQARVRGK